MGTKILAVVPLLAEHQGSSKDSPESEQEHVGKVA